MKRRKVKEASQRQQRKRVKIRRKLTRIKKKISLISIQWILQS